MRQLTVIAFIFFFFTSCRKKYEPVNTTETVPVSSEIQSWCLFKPGTYWIYKDSVSGREDSVYVLSVTNDVVQHNSGSNVIGKKIINEQRIIITLKVDSIFSYKSYILSSYPYDRLVGTNGSIWTFDIFRPDSTKLDPVYGIIKNYPVSQLALPVGVLSDVRGVNFSYVFQYASTPMIYFKENNYWKKGIGLLKRKHTFESSHQSLLRYNIVQ
jgi:hypothetical protein